jgi:hypothetical protein
VGDAPGQVSDRLHLLRLPQLLLAAAQRLFALLALGNVAQHRQQVRLAFVADRRAVHLDEELRPVLAQGSGVGPERPPRTDVGQ